MGKVLRVVEQSLHRGDYHNQDASIFESESSCNSLDDNINNDYNDALPKTIHGQHGQHDDDDDEEDVKELLIVGAGPHALALMLRLLEPDPDLLSDRERHHRAESTKRLRPRKDVYRHLKDLSRGPSVVYKSSKIRQKNRPINTPSSLPIPPPSLSLDEILQKVTVVDSLGDWLTSWKQNFETIGIQQLRSLMNAHTDPYDHRAMEFWAEMHGRGDELVTLPLLSQRDKKFKGPYQVPTTSLFHDFHELLIKAYGIDGIVQKGTVDSIIPMQRRSMTSDALFDVKINYGSGGFKIVKAKRVVCAMGSNFCTNSGLWSECLLNCNTYGSTCSKNSHEKILQPHEIVPWLSKNTWEQNTNDETDVEQQKSLLIVGGGTTSAQLTLLASKSSWCKSVTLIQRSKSLLRHFDLENKWMGPQRGKLLTEFLSMNMKSRSHQLKEARKGGSIPPHLLRELYQRAEKYPMECCIKEEVEIVHIHQEGEKLWVTLSDGLDETEYDMIWLCTGSANHIDRFAPLASLRKTLPLDVVNGFPCIDRSLNWCSCANADNGNDVSNNESKTADDPLQEDVLDSDDRVGGWMQTARKRLWCMGPLASLQLGPDALNLVGARQGAVQIAKAIRLDISLDEQQNL